MPITIAYVAPWVTVGGSDKATVDWFRRIDQRRFRALLVTTQPSENELLRLVEPHAAEIHVLPDEMPADAMPEHLAELVETRDVSVLHVMNSRLGFDMLPALRDAYPRLATVVQLHAEEADHSGYVRYVTARYDDVVDAYSVVSDDLRARFVHYGVAPEKIAVIHLGVDAHDEFTPGPPPDPPLFERREPEDLEVLFAGRLVEQKDPMLMVRVATMLRDTGTAVRIHVVGDGHLGTELERAVTANGLTDRVLLHGVSHDMLGWYRATDAVLLTSTYEGVPMVVYEAMACASPVVAADVGAVGELVDATTGYLIRDRADAASYADAILRLARDPSLRERLGAAARARVVADYTLDHMARAHEELYEQCVSVRAREPAGHFDANAWRDWAPRATVPLWLEVSSRAGTRRLVTAAMPPVTGTWVLVARLWSRPYPDTAALVEHRRRRKVRYELVAGDAPGSLGYASLHGLPGMLPLGATLAGVTAGDPSLGALAGWVQPPTASPARSSRP